MFVGGPTNVSVYGTISIHMCIPVYERVRVCMSVHTTYMYAHAIIMHMLIVTNYLLQAAFTHMTDNT